MDFQAVHSGAIAAVLVFTSGSPLIVIIVITIVIVILTITIITIISKMPNSTTTITVS